MAKLSSISLKHNCLVRLPEMDGLHALWYLDVSDNMLVDIPASLADSKSLVHMDFSGNRLTTVPAWITALQGGCAWRLR